jgi:hypothetical protein
MLFRTRLCRFSWIIFPAPNVQLINMRSLFLTLLLAGTACGAILPETIGAWKRGDPAPAPAPDLKVWNEYGLQASETSPYSDGVRSYTITAYRFNDATGALAAFDEIRPAGAKPLVLMGLSAQTESDEFVAGGNYLFVFKGYKIKPEEMSHLFATVPNYEHSPLPSLPGYLPAGALANSERYITGPQSLAAFAPSIPPGTAAFHFSSEAQLARYRSSANGTAGKETTLVVFSYPTMEMARDRYPHFQGVPGAVVKRTGPLVALTLNAPSADDAERLLAQVKYQISITIPERLPTPRDNPANLFLNIFILCAVLAGFMVISGLVFGGIRILFRRSGASGDGEAMISLHLSGRP